MSSPTITSYTTNRYLTEVGYSARDARQFRAGLADPPVGAMPVEYATPRAEDRAGEVLALLADRGHHRAPSIPDLLGRAERFGGYRGHIRGQIAGQVDTLRTTGR